MNIHGNVCFAARVGKIVGFGGRGAMGQRKRRRRTVIKAETRSLCSLLYPQPVHKDQAHNRRSIKISLLNCSCDPLVSV